MEVLPCGGSPRHSSAQTNYVQISNITHIKHGMSTNKRWVFPILVVNVKWQEAEWPGDVRCVIKHELPSVLVRLSPNCPLFPGQPIFKTLGKDFSIVSKCQHWFGSAECFWKEPWPLFSHFSGIFTMNPFGLMDIPRGDTESHKKLYLLTQMRP